MDFKLCDEKICDKRLDDAHYFAFVLRCTDLKSTNFPERSTQSVSYMCMVCSNFSL